MVAILSRGDGLIFAHALRLKLQGMVRSWFDDPPMTSSETGWVEMGFTDIKGI